MLRTRASPEYRSTMRPKLVHGTKSMTWAKTAFPTFTVPRSLLKPEKLPDRRGPHFKSTPRKISRYALPLVVFLLILPGLTGQQCLETAINGGANFIVTLDKR